MMMTLLQTPAISSDSHWQFWVNVAVAVLMPVILFFLTSMRNRLKEGDLKFETQGKLLAVMNSQLEGITKTVDGLAVKLEDTKDKTNEERVEGAGIMALLKAEIEKDFVRKSEFRSFVQENRETNAKILEAVMGMQQKGCGH